MSASDPPPSSADRQPDDPPPMSVMAALGWTLAALFAQILINTVSVKLRAGSEQDLVRAVASQAIAYLLVVFAILRVHAPEASIRDFLGLRRTSLALYPLGLLLGASLWLPAEALLSQIERRFPIKGTSKFAEEIFAGSTPRRALVVLAVVALGPLIEEVLIRGALFRALRRSYPRGVVVVVTAALFALVHELPQILLPIGLMGLALGYLRDRSGSLLPGILAHAAFNACTTALVLVRGPSAPDPEIPGLVVIGSTLAAALLLFLIRVVGDRSATALSAQELDRR